MGDPDQGHEQGLDGSYQETRARGQGWVQQEEAQRPGPHCHHGPHNPGQCHLSRHGQGSGTSPNPGTSGCCFCSCASCSCTGPYHTDTRDNISWAPTTCHNRPNQLTRTSPGHGLRVLTVGADLGPTTTETQDNKATATKLPPGPQHLVPLTSGPEWLQPLHGPPGPLEQCRRRPSASLPGSKVVSQLQWEVGLKRNQIYASPFLLLYL